MLRTFAPNLSDPPLSTRPGADLSGALTGAIASIPQTLAYGLIVGGALGPDHLGIGILAALYGSVIVGLIAAIFGGCPYLVSGPRAATLLVFAGLIGVLKEAPGIAGLAEPGLAAFVLACAAAAIAALLQIAFGILRLGRLAHYIPLPVVAGFINGSALLIILSQVWPALGLARERSLLDLPAHLGAMQPGTLLLSALTIALVFGLRSRSRRPSMLLWAVSVASLIYLAADALGFGSALGGALPSPPTDAGWRFIGAEAVSLLSGPDGGELMRLILPAAISMAILSSLDTLLATAAVDEATLRHSQAGRQLGAEGAGNLLASLFAAIPGSSSMLRTQAALNGGMVSAAAPIGIALLTLAATALLGPLLPYLSQAVMAGLLIALGIDLFDKWTLARIRGALANERTPLVALGDLLTMLVVVAVTLFADLVTAVGVGILVALLSFVVQMARSPVRRVYRATALLARIHGDPWRRRFIEHHGREIAVIEVEGALFFGSSAKLREEVDKLLDDGIRHIALDMKRVADIDATGARALERLNHRIDAHGGLLTLGYLDRERRMGRINAFGRPRRGLEFVPRRIWLKLSYLGTLRAIGEGRFFHDIDGAVAACEAHLAAALPARPLEPELAMPPILHGIGRAALGRLKSHVARLSFEPGTTVFAQGDAPTAAFLLVAGRVDVLLDLPGTERKLKVQSLGPGAIFGEMALLAPQPRSATVVAQERSVCYALDAQAMERLKRDHSSIAFALLGNVAVIFAERLRATNNMLSEMDA